MTANSGLTVVQMGVVKGSRQGALFKAKDVDSRQGLLAKRNKLAAHNIWTLLFKIKQQLQSLIDILNKINC